jgi:hypothetical protein
LLNGIDSMLRSRRRLLRDRRQLLESLRAYEAGEIGGVLGEGDDHFIESIRRRLESINAELEAYGASRD